MRVISLACCGNRRSYLNAAKVVWLNEMGGAFSKYGQVFEIDVTNEHDHAGVFEADDAIRGSLFVYYISTFGNGR